MSDPQVIIGRFASRPDDEWSVAVGCRLVAPNSLTPNAVLRVTAFEYRDGELHVRLDCEDPSGRSLAGLIREDFIFAMYKPAPRESRWLDPAIVPVGRKLHGCTHQTTLGAHTCVYPSRDPDAARTVSTKCLCFVHAIQLSTNTRRFNPARLPPSALTPAPRWKHKPPRVRHTNLAYIRCGDQEDEGSNFVFHAPPKTPRVRKVREGVRVSPAGATSAGWTAV